MIAKYNGLCKVTNQVITAGVTEIKKINGQWQVVAKGGKVLPAGSKVTSYGNEYLPHEIEGMEQAQRDRELADNAFDKWAKDNGMIPTQAEESNLSTDVNELFNFFK